MYDVWSGFYFIGWNNVLCYKVRQKSTLVTWNSLVCFISVTNLGRHLAVAYVFPINIHWIGLFLVCIFFINTYIFLIKTSFLHRFRIHFYKIGFVGTNKYSNFKQMSFKFKIVFWFYVFFEELKSDKHKVQCFVTIAGNGINWSHHSELSPPFISLNKLLELFSVRVTFVISHVQDVYWDTECFMCI